MIVWMLFWSGVIISVALIIVVKFTPFKDLPQPSWFNYGDEALDVIYDISMGYIVSAIFYLMVVYYPEKVKKIKIERIAMDEIECICIDAIMVIVLAYKNVSDENEWNFKDLEDDAQLFNDKFYEKMKLFDAYKNSDTRLCIKEDDGSTSEITWDDKLESVFQDCVNRIDEIITKYIYFLDDEIIDKLLLFRNNKLIVGYLGLPSNKMITVYKGTDGTKYAERISLNIFRQDPNGKKNLLFNNSGVVDNGNILHDYIDTLLSLRELGCKKAKFHRDVAIEYFCREGCGQYGIAISNDD